MDAQCRLNHAATTARGRLLRHAAEAARGWLRRHANDAARGGTDAARGRLIAQFLILTPDRGPK